MRSNAGEKFDALSVRIRQLEGRMAGNAEEIKKHEAAKAAFDVLNGKPIPKVAQLSQEYAALLAEKKEENRRGLPFWFSLFLLLFLGNGGCGGMVSFFGRAGI